MSNSVGTQGRSTDTGLRPVVPWSRLTHPILIPMTRQSLAPFATTLFLVTSQVPLNAQTRLFGIDNPRAAGELSRATEARFEQSLKSFGTETFDSMAPFLYRPSLSFGSTGIHATLTDSEPLGGCFVNDYSSLSISPPKGLFTFARETTFTFNHPIDAFGTFLIGAGGQGVDLFVDVLLQNTLLGTSRRVDLATFPADADLFNVAYFGIVDRAQPFDRVILRQNDFNAIELDSITVGHAVPEGGTTLAMMALGLGGLMYLKGRHAICVLH